MQTETQEQQELDWLWELTVSPELCEETYDSDDEDAEPVGLCFKSNSHAHLVAFNLALISGVVGRKLDNITIDRENKTLTAFFDVEWNNEDLNILNEAVDLNREDPVVSGILPLFVDDEVCLSIRTQHENKLSIEKFFALWQDDEEPVEQDGKRGFILHYEDSDETIIEGEQDVFTYRDPYIVLRGKEAKELDTQLLAYELSIASNQDKLSILRSYQSTIIAPMESAQERKKVDKVKRKSKRKAQKAARKKARR